MDGRTDGWTDGWTDGETDMGNPTDAIASKNVRFKKRWIDVHICVYWLHHRLL